MGKKMNDLDFVPSFREGRKINEGTNFMCVKGLGIFMAKTEN
jgi:hypothetical protein